MKIGVYYDDPETVPEDQVSLLEETITPRHNLPPLLHKLSERKPERLDWIGNKYFYKYNFINLKSNFALLSSKCHNFFKFVFPFKISSRTYFPAGTYYMTPFRLD